jgi:hypothetical protein
VGGRSVSGVSSCVLNAVKIVGLLHILLSDLSPSKNVR